MDCRVVSSLSRRDAFYPLPPSDATTLLEASIGVQCWFTQTFRHVFPRVRGREQWISVETTDNLWVYIGNTLVGERWGCESLVSFTVVSA